MTAITVGTIPAKSAAAKSPATKAPVAGKGLFARVVDAFVAARMRQAEREIARHRHLLPGQLEAVGERLAPRSEKDLPFAR
ncbi:hypothetical protein [Pseudorhodoplanes sp.]|uniref:hypothetical protein n=1 Tax=Pseudorhodoplanes sp. TaxID=1934341 RepID=UPI002B5E38AD|nr:hypothetical protein [Pseudorhodoplanes sp.]HWV52729.1 hypothetical protein [Pseudorhodoplanes sp.]